MKNFKSGDYVRVKKFKIRPLGWNSSGLMDYLMGKVVKIKRVSHFLLEITDENGESWILLKNEVEPVNNCIVIYQRNDQVIALDNTTGKKAVAKCNPADTFDFNTGARLAFDRLLEDKPEKTPLNVKIVFTRGDDTFKTGHIYEVKDGNLESPNSGMILPGFPLEDFTKFYSIEELKDYFTSRYERKLHKGGWSYKALDFIVIEED